MANRITAEEGNTMRSQKSILSKNDNAKNRTRWSPRGILCLYTEEQMPVYGERIIITEKMAKLNELVIRKRKNS